MSAPFVIYTGDAYPIRISLLMGGQAVTDEGISRVRIGLGQYIAEWPNGALAYSEGLWAYPLTQEISTSIPLGKTQFMAQVSTDGTNYYPSAPIEVLVKQGLGKAGE